MFAERLKELRKSSGLLQKDMADKIGITKSAYGYYEQGKTTPDIVTTKKIADILNVSVDYLLSGEVEERSENKEIMAKNIEFFMNKKGVTRSEVATAIGVPYTTLCAWLQCKTYPRIDKIEKMADYFGVRKSDLVENDSFETNLQKEIAEADARLAKEKQELLELLSILDENDMEKLVDYFKLLIAAKGK